MPGAQPTRGSCCLFCCQNGCFGVENGKAAERPASLATLAGSGWFWFIPHRLHARLFWRLGQAGIGAASSGHTRTRIFPTRRLRFPRELRVYFGQYIQRGHPRLHLRLHQTRNGHTTFTKFYNKVLCQFEAGNVRESFGGHLAHYVDSTNRHLRRTLLHPDVQRRGCTRVEISLYPCNTEDLSTTVAEELIAEALVLANTEEGLFVVQPPAKQWENLAKHLDRCMVLGDRLQGVIYLAWSGHSKTNRVQGMLVKPTAATVADDVKWERAMHWTMADFGYQNCPIFFTEIVGMEGSEVLFSPLRCYTKIVPTILAASKKPCELHPDAPYPQDLLPPTEQVEWVWRTKKQTSRWKSPRASWWRCCK